MKSFCQQSHRRLWTVNLFLAGIAVCGLVPWSVTAQEADEAPNGVESRAHRAIAASSTTNSAEQSAQRTPSHQAQPAAAVEPAGRIMRVFVVGEDKQPLAGARVHSSITTREAVWANREYVTDGDGKVVISLPQQPDIVRLWARRDGYVPMWVHWWMEFDDDKTPVPEEFTLELPQGTIVGGLVRNEDGAPIEGVKVEVRREPVSFGEPMRQLLFDTWLATGDAAVTTDAEGRWTLSNVPDGDDFAVLLKLSHPDYISDYAWGGLQWNQNFLGAGTRQDPRATMVALRERSATILMQRGIQVTGTVTDPDGIPVPQAVVIWGDDPYDMEGSQEVLTNDQGVYRLAPLPAGRMSVTVVARGWAPTRREIQITAENPPVDFQLEPGETVRMRFVDEAGDPVPAVYVRIDQWRGGQSLYSHRHPNIQDLHVPRLANQQGIYEWTWAPEDEVTYHFGKRGFASTSRRLGPGDHVITLFD